MNWLLLLGVLLLANPVGAELELNGTNQRLSVDTGLLDGRHRTSLWIKPASLGGNNLGILYQFCDNSRVQLVATNTIQIIRPFTTEVIVKCANNSITLDAWQRVLIEYPNSKTATDYHIYIDSANGLTKTECSYQTQQNGAGSILACLGSDIFRIGNNLAGTRGFDGPISDFAIWTETNTFTTEEGQQLSMAVKYLPLMFAPNLLHTYLPLDDCGDGTEGGSASCPAAKNLDPENLDFDFVNSPTYRGTGLFTYP